MGTSPSRFVLLLLVAAGWAAGCAGSGSAVRLADAGLPPDASWDELPESVRGSYETMARLADPEVRLDRPPYPVGGMADLMRGLSYPEKARKDKIEGTVIVRAVVSPEGEVVEAEIWQSAHPLLDAEALAVVQQAQFHSAQKDGRAVTASVCAPITFRLR